MPNYAAQVIIRFTADNQPMENVMYVKHEHSTDSGATWANATFDSGAADNVASDVDTWLSGQWAPFAASNCSAIQSEIVWNDTVGTGPLHGQVYSGSPYPIAGSLTGGPLPNSVTVAVGLRTKLLGRSFHGRVYFVGLGKDHVDDATPNALNVAGATGIIALFENLRTALHANHGVGLLFDRFPMEVASFRSGGADRTTGLFTDVDHIALSDNYLDNQRRRLPGHNRHG
jgi:hypothetical protein